MTKLRDGYFRQINSKVGDDNYLLKAQGGYIGLHTGRNNEANKVVRTDENGYIQAGWINTTSGNFTGTPTRIYASDDGYIRYMTSANFFPTLTNSGNDISITIGGQNRTLTVGFATNSTNARKPYITQLNDEEGNYPLVLTEINSSSNYYNIYKNYNNIWWNPFLKAFGHGVGVQATGASSHAEGYYSIASGYDSHAEGCRTTASGDYSHAEGDSTTASGEHSHSEGESTTAQGGHSHSEGKNTVAGGANSHAEGFGTSANGVRAHSEGSDTIASGNRSHAEGSESRAFGYASHAEGNYTTAGVEGRGLAGDPGQCSHSEGEETVASGKNSHAEGYKSQAIGNYSHAEGENTQARGLYTHTEGFQSYADGDYSHAEGRSSANGQYSHSEGLNSTTNARYAHAEGYHSYATGEAAHAEGYEATASGNYSHSSGYNTIASHPYEAAFGKFNVSNSNTLFSVGYGNTNNDRKNLFEVKTNGNIYFNGASYYINGSYYNGTANYANNLSNPAKYYWANLTLQTGSLNTTVPSFGAIRMNGVTSAGTNYITGTAGRIYFGGNFHIDSLGSNATYINHYTANNVYLVSGSSQGNVGIGTTSPGYKLQISGDSYTTGWSRAANGFYVEGNDVHFTHQGSVGEIDMTSNNEFLWGSSSTTLYFNFRAVSRGTTVNNYIWNAGSSTSWASHNMGNIWLNGSGVSLRLGPQNSSHAHYETNASVSHWFNKRVDVNGDIWRYGTNYGISSDGYFYAKGVYANRDGASTYGGISLYSTSDPITEYGIAFRGTGNYGKIGRVQGDWATYFTMDSSHNRGWIFRSGGTNYASVSARGEAYFSAVGTNGYIAYPSGGFFSSDGSTTGYIIITIPANYRSCTMMRFNVEIYNYSTGTSTTYTIGGYNYTDGNWYNVFAYANRQGTTGYGNLTVRFGHNGTNSIIWIGESNTSYSYPKVRITNVTLGHSNADYNTWASGWSVTIATTAPTNVSQTVTNPATNYYAESVPWSGITGKPASKTIWGQTYINASGEPQNVNGLCSITANGQTMTLGSQNSSWGHIETTAANFYFNKSLHVAGHVYSYSNASYDLGGSSNKWRYLYLYNRAYLDEWIQFSGNSGLYWPNSNSATHLYPNNVTTYGNILIRGSRNGYSGIQLNNSTNYMTVMDNGSDKGLYNESNGRWIYYYSRTNDKVGILTSSLTKTINLSGQTYISTNTWIGTTSGSEMLNVGGWVGTTGSTGWYNSSYGGGIYMSDSTYVRVYNDKRFYNSNTSQYAFYTSGGITVGTHFWGTSGASSWLQGQRDERAVINITNKTDGSSFWPIIRWESSSQGRWDTIGVLGNNLYFMSSVTSRTDNGYDTAAYIDMTTSRLYSNGLYHTSYGSSAYALTSDGGVARISDMSVNYASSAGDADSVDGQHFNWNNNKNDHTYLWAASSNGQAYLVHRASISVNYANTAERAKYLSGHSSSPDNSHPGHGAKVFYSWNTGSVGNATSGYSNGITIGSHPSDTGYGFQIVQNMWDDRTYTRRYNGGWQEWKTLAWTSDIPTVGNGTVTITQNGTNKGSFTLNQSGNATINLTDYYPIRSYTSGLQISSYAGSANCQLWVPYAGTGQSGVVTTTDQSFSGNKTFAKINDIKPNYLLFYAGRVYKASGGASCSIISAGGIFSISVVKKRAGAYQIKLTNNTGKSCYIHPMLSPIFGDKGGGSCYEHGFAYFSQGDGYEFPLSVSNGTSKTFTIICGYMHTQRNWSTNDFTKSDDNGGFICEMFATWSNY